jgi:hypothetical protein
MQDSVSTRTNTALQWPRADCWREQHRHSSALALVPGSNEPLSILKHLDIGRAPAGRFFRCGLTALILQLAAVEAHFARRLNAMHNVIQW